MTRHALVRADGDGQIGLGHLLRTMAVADELARTGTSITYVCKTVMPWIAELLDARGYRVHRLDVPAHASQAEDAEATALLAEQDGIDTVLLDHYDLTSEWTESLVARTNCRLAAFDDLASDPRRVDLLVDPSPGRQASDYRALLPGHALCLSGPRYAALRSEFALVKGKPSPPQDGIIRVVISMGGSDPLGTSLICLEALDGQFKAGSNVEITVILGSAAPMLAATQARVARMTTRTRMLLDCTNMAAALANADLVIGAGGTSALERCALGLPSVLTVLADNQRYNAAQLAAAGAAVVLPDISEDAVRAAVLPLLKDTAARRKMGQAAAALCDGKGAPRVAHAIYALSGALTLRGAEPQDMTLIHALQSEPQARRYARMPQVPTLEEHATWFAARLRRAQANPFYVVMLDEEPCGFVRLDAVTPDGPLEVSIVIAQSAQGKGVACQALGHLRLTHPRRHIVAHVHPDNTASQRLFERAGYERTAADQFMSAGWADIAERQTHEDQQSHDQT